MGSCVQSGAVGWVRKPVLSTVCVPTTGVWTALGAGSLCTVVHPRRCPFKFIVAYRRPLASSSWNGGSLTGDVTEARIPARATVSEVAPSLRWLPTTARRGQRWRATRGRAWQLRRCEAAHPAPFCLSDRLAAGRLNRPLSQLTVDLKSYRGTDECLVRAHRRRDDQQLAARAQVRRYSRVPLAEGSSAY